MQNREIVLPDGSFLEMRPLLAIDHLVACRAPEEQYQACLIALSCRIDGKPLSLPEVLNLPLELYIVALKAVVEPLTKLQSILGGIK